jgi:hypothetical protein
MLNVAIAVDSPTDYGPRAAWVVSAACEEVIGEARCPVASDLEPGAVAAWYAVVHPNDRALTSVRIEFRDRTEQGVLIEERSLTFAPRDSQQSRLASVGSVIAALAAAREGSLTRPPSRPAPQSAEPLAPLAARPPRAAPPADWSVELAGLVAPTFGDGPARFGGMGSAHFGWHTRPFALVSARYAAHPGNPSFAWAALSAGVGARLGEPSAAFDLEFSGELVLEHANVAASRGADHESAGQNGWGGRVGVGAVWAAFRHCSIIFGVDGTVVLPRINVVVGDADATRVPAASLGLLLGVRFQP